MVRRCVVPSCVSTDLTTLVHRFPRKHCTTWQTSLQLNSYSVKDLLEKFVVCSHHFRVTDYRHKESKHLNTTAIPTLDVIPDKDKISEVPTNNGKGRGHPIASATNNLHSDSVAQKTQTYSDCVTSRSCSLQLANNVNHSIDQPVSASVDDSDISIENHFYSDCDIIEEEIDMDEEMCLESSNNCSIVCANDLPKYESVTELIVEEDCDEQINHHYAAENGSTFEEIASDCETDPATTTTTENELNGRLTNYVELIETNEDSDDDDDDELELMDDANEILFKDYSRKELIDELLAARSRIKELETKLENIQKAHVSMIQNLNNFNKVLIS